MCRRVRSGLDTHRYRHVLGVARTAEALARRYGAPREKARIAGLLHDIARSWEPAALMQYAREHALRLSEAEQTTPVLLHGRIGADIARREFGIEDPQTLAAIEHHTVAIPGMSDLEKILYIADSIEPSRTFADRAALAALAEKSLDEGMLGCIASSLEYLLSQQVPIAPETILLYNELARRHGVRPQKAYKKPQ